MKIIGLNIYQQTDISHSRSLVQGWYPLIESSEPGGIHESRPPLIKQCIPKYFFNIFEGMPKINISCIVGLNGSGKSTFVDFLLKIINNFTVTVFGGEGDDELLSLCYVNGIYCDLYFQIDEIIYCIRNLGESIQLFSFDEKGNKTDYIIHGIEYEESLKIVSGLCFTICVNYGLHSFNPNFLNKFNDNLKGLKHTHWFDRIFHILNDYHIPLEILPHRNNGIIDINEENKLTRQRFAALSLLLYNHQKESFLKNYIPHHIEYELKRMPLEIAKKQYESVLGMNPDNLDNDLLCLFDCMHKCWEAWLKENMPNYNNNIDVGSTIINFLTLESLKISVSNMPYLKHIRQFQSLDNKMSPEKLCGLIIRELLSENSYITANIHSSINLLRSKTYDDKHHGNIAVEKILGDNNYVTYYDIVSVLPPSCYYYECYFSDGINHKLNIDCLSSGERQLIFSLSAVLVHLSNLSNLPKTDDRRIRYHHVNIILDEIELYFHPDFQREFIYQFLKCIATLNLNTESVKSINFILVTHSPFVLSDIPSQNVLYLGHENNSLPKTFGANIYDSLKDGFFMEGAMGKVVTDKIKKLIEVFYEKDEELQENHFLQNRREFEFIAHEVEDEYFKKVLRRFYDTLKDKYFSNER